MAYQNPLRDILGLSPERVDQGVDYSGVGPIYALGNAVIENVRASGWPGGIFIQYKLLDGPNQNSHVYVAEDINPAVTVGQVVGPNTPLGYVYKGATGIETGWAQSNPAAQRAAGSADWREGGSSTAAGVDFNNLLTSLGAPSGIIHGPVAGTFKETGGAGTTATNAPVDATLTSGEPCLFALPSISGPFGLGSVGGQCLVSASAGRALLGAVSLLAGVGLMALGVALMASSSKAGRAVTRNVPLIAAAV